MYNNPSNKYNIPSGAGCQDPDSGLKILARLIARRHLRLNSLRPEQPEDKSSDNGNDSKDLPDA
jgi:hypothetical protein